MMEFSIFMGLLSIVLISVAFGMVIQRRLIETEEAETRTDR